MVRFADLNLNSFSFGKRNDLLTSNNQSANYNPSYDNTPTGEFDFQKAATGIGQREVQQSYDDGFTLADAFDMNRQERERDRDLQREMAEMKDKWRQQARFDQKQQGATDRIRETNMRNADNYSRMQQQKWMSEQAQWQRNRNATANQVARMRNTVQTSPTNNDIALKQLEMQERLAEKELRNQRDIADREAQIAKMRLKQNSSGDSLSFRERMALAAAQGMF